MTNKAYKSIIEDSEELKTWVGKELGLSEWLEITQENINTFAKLTRDEQWIHVDVERSLKESPFKQPVAHGFLVLSFASYFGYECFEVKGFVMGVNYGMNKVRFISPVAAGAKIRGRIVLQSVEDIEGGCRYVMNVTFELQGSTKPACVAEFVALAFTA
ncbi:MAG: MaoC family dehydratase [Bacteroidota bacterium]